VPDGIIPTPVQWEALSSEAEFALLGGAAGGGKSYTLQMTAQQNVGVPGLTMAMFRQERSQFSGGGLWDEMQDFFAKSHADTNEQMMRARWRRFKSSIHFFGLNNLASVKRKQVGKQYDINLYDEIDLIDLESFIYTLSRNRSSIPGFTAYSRATCNPKSNHWLRELVDPYILPSGFANYDLSGKIIYFCHYQGKFYHGWTIEELAEVLDIPRNPEGLAYVRGMAITFTFIPSSLEDNPHMGPGYRKRLLQQTALDQARLLSGNWNAREDGNMFPTDLLRKIEHIDESQIVCVCRAWDLAGSVPRPGNKDPDFTAGVKLALLKDGTVAVLDVKHVRLGPSGVNSLVTETAYEDDKMHNGRCWILIERLPAAAGLFNAQSWEDMLTPQHNLEMITHTSDRQKTERARPLVSLYQSNQMAYLDRSWTNGLIEETKLFPYVRHDDRVDAKAIGWNWIREKYRVRSRGVAPKTGARKQKFGFS